jgi:23S rRNA (adenine2503-C2)-methyltransferase
MKIKKPWILELELGELQEELHAAGFRAYTARQVFQWLYQKNNQDPSSWSNINTQDREKLSGLYDCGCRPVISVRSDEQGTRKYLVGLEDGQKIETVLIKEKDHYTFCLSTQVG